MAYDRKIKTFADLVTGDVIRFTNIKSAYLDMTITKIEDGPAKGQLYIDTFRPYVHFDADLAISYIGHEDVKRIFVVASEPLEQRSIALVEQVSDTEINMRIVRNNSRLARELTDFFANTDNSHNLRTLVTRIIDAGGSKGR